MDEKKKVEFRYYDIPKGDLVLALMGPAWNKPYGEGPDRLHFHNFYEVGICSGGEGEMTLGEKVFPFSAGCISLIPITELHTTNTFGKNAAWEWMYFDMHEMLRELYPDDESLRENILHVIEKQGKLLTPDMDIQKITFLVRSIFSELKNREYMYREMVEHFLLMLVVEIIRKLENTELPDKVSVKIDIFPAISYIKEHYGEAVRIASLARICGMSESCFRKFFEKYMNMKPLDYLNFVRIQKSCSMLRETEMSLMEIADRIGYDSVSSFIRNFRRIVGNTPHRWRVDEKNEKNKFLHYNVTALKGWME